MDDAFAFSSSQLPNEAEHDAHGLQEHNASWLFSADQVTQPCVLAGLSTDARQRLRQDVEERDDLRRELEAFVERLREQQCDGDLLIEFPNDYESIVERLFVENKRGYASLRDWSGPRRYQDLPISRLAIEESEEDRKTIDGLRTIDELDRILQDKTVEEYFVQRQTFPAKRTLECNLFLKISVRHFVRRQERAQLKRMARLRAAVHSLDGDNDNTNFGGDRRRSHLRPAQQAHLNALINMSDDELCQNPFDCDVTLPDDMWTSCQDNATSRSWDGASHSLSCRTGEAVSSIGRDATSKSFSLYQSLKPDYLQEQRRQKEIQQRLRQIESDLHKLRTGDVYDCLVTSDRLQQIVDESRSELHNNNVDIQQFAGEEVMEILKGNHHRLCFS